MKTIRYHTTPKRRLASILRFGLLPGLAQSPTKRVWVHGRSRINWAQQHVRSRHHVEEVVVLELLIDRRQLQRFTRGIWWTATVIPATCIVSINGLRLYRPE